jgi:A/G-specific adenine glycosylase
MALRGQKWMRDAPYYNLAEELLERESPGDWNQALMELGATVCVPRRPCVPRVPWRADCRAGPAESRRSLPRPAAACAAWT